MWVALFIVTHAAAMRWTRKPVPSLYRKRRLSSVVGYGCVDALASGGLAMVANLELGTAPAASLVRSMMLYQIGPMLAMPQGIAGSMAPFPDRAGGDQRGESR
jgi:hypothetical protein